MDLAAEIADRIAAIFCPDSTFTDRRLAMAARNIEDVGRLAEAGNRAAQGADYFLAFGDLKAEVAGAGRRSGWCR